MRKVLMGTTALVAASVIAGGVAQADEMMAEPISVGVGGFYKTAIGFPGGDAGDNAHSPALAQHLNLRISGSTTLDNGLTVGVKINIENDGGDAGDDPLEIDERNLYFSGGFGTLNVGSMESAAQLMTNFAPNAASNFGVNTPFFTFAADGYLRTYDDGIGDEDALKVVYFSPTFNGFRVGASFAPDDSDAGQYGNNADNDGGSSSHWSIGAEYSTDMDDFGLRVSAGFESYDIEDTGAVACAGECSPTALRLGAGVNTSGLALGGGMLRSDAGGNERTDYDLGVSYGEGAWTYALQWGHSGDDGGEIDRYAVNASYALGPGIDLQVQVDTGDNSRVGRDWTQLMLGTHIGF